VEDVVAKRLGRDFFAEDVHAVARGLLGTQLLVDNVGGTIVEVEAYSPDDPASHSFCGRTGRNATMFGPPGHAYVYRSYGIHWCLNAVCDREGIGAAVLIRALVPTHGTDAMRARRSVEDERLLCSGPGRLTQALGVSGAHDGLALDAPPFVLLEAQAACEIELTTRIGISRGVDRPWRYVVRGSPFVSRAPRPA
jgi:DNA-3-methyladenine glycosylase